MVFGVRTKVVYFKNISNIRDIASIFTLFVAKRNMKTDNQALNFQMASILKMGPPTIQNLANNKKK